MAVRHAFPRFERSSQDKGSGWLPLDLGGHEVVARLHMRLRPGAEAAGEGRHALDRLDGAIGDDQLTELRLLVTELLTNSVRHGGADERAWITLEVEIYANAVRVVVTDTGRGFEPDPSPQPHLERPGGWGLYLVDRLSDRWGVESHGTTSVWFEVDRETRSLASTA
jgi:anti-sigma regulatory factor (Ser/Thr protein kinase)